jgi:hypothetical protein
LTRPRSSSRERNVTRSSSEDGRRVSSVTSSPSDEDRHLGRSLCWLELGRTCPRGRARPLRLLPTLLLLAGDADLCRALPGRGSQEIAERAGRPATERRTRLAPPSCSSSAWRAFVLLSASRQLGRDRGTTMSKLRARSHAPWGLIMSSHSHPGGWKLSCRKTWLRASVPTSTVGSCRWPST